jgi:uncharacterized protein YgiB involved in biofilm formation
MAVAGRRRLRSGRVAWARLGGAALLLGVAGCGDEPAPPAPRIVGSVEQCMLVGNSKADCEAAFAKAQEEHAKAAPKFADTQSCEQQFGAGNCQPAKAPSTSGSGSLSDVFVPAIVGYMIGQALSGGGSPTPIYRDTRGYNYAPGREPWANAPVERDGRGRSVWTDSRQGGSGTTARAPSGATTIAPPPASPQRGVLGATGRSSSTSSSSS